MKNLILSALLLAVFMAGCNKSADPGITRSTTSDTLYYFVNQASRDIQVDLYRSVEDRDARTNMIYATLLPANDTVPVPFSKLDTTQGIQYYFDIYTPDHSYSAWGNYNYSSGVSIFPSFVRFLDLGNYRLSQAEYFYLNGGNVSTSWKAIDKRQANNQSVWATLNDNEKYMRATINRNATALIQHKQASDGLMLVNNITGIFTDASPSSPLTMLTLYENGSTSIYKFYNCSRVPASVSDTPPAHDTIALADWNYYWIMVHE